MAKKIIYIDDIDGSEDADTIEFSYQGTRYSVDLSEKNQIELRKALAPFIENARKTSGTSSSTRKAASSRRTGEIREWLRSNGHAVPDRGTIRAELVKLWESR
ncbi:Lsr2 family protein [Microbacterium sp. KSW4-16]|uniref:histone-like nucleoid-structuring protein Lsr2 n=1 Tax=Microbacterium aurugineum TaxID=2851642 RepID=UPI0020BF1428|nr:Lsr2 family protein [Microbacterium aurugineum]MCK8468277.1 Lsr2 family protein [Microbacterium aurugineum]